MKKSLFKQKSKRGSLTKGLNGELIKLRRAFATLKKIFEADCHKCKK